MYYFTDLEKGLQLTLQPLEIPQSTISPHASTTDVESTTVEPISTDHETQGSQIQEEVQHPLELQIPSDTESSKIEPPSPSTPISE